MPVWDIKGAMKKDGSDVDTSVGGQSEEHVRAWAAKKGILISSIKMDTSTPLIPAMGNADRQLEVLMSINRELIGIHFWIRLGGMLLLLSLIGAVISGVARVLI